MGNREKLLAGAKRCLYEQGYARTTARDVATAAGVSLAAIGYHFGSLEALLNAAVMQAIEEWGDRLASTLAAESDPHAGSLDRFTASWTRAIESLDTDRPLWLITFEIFAQSEHQPQVRQFLADAVQEGRLGLAALFQHIDSATDERTAWLVGSFYQALMTGVITQWLIDPARAPSGRDLADALRIVAAETSPNNSGVAGAADSTSLER